MSCIALGQKFSTHAVKQGESLEDIAKQYGVSTAAILRYNKEIKPNQGLPVNAILVVPAEKPLPFTKESGVPTVAPQDSVKQREPIGFKIHKVRKRETVFGITQNYGITEAELKKYNQQLYASPLQKKMELRIPQYKKEEEVENVINLEDYETYIVEPKETRWSIAHKYGITIDSMLVLNPALSKTSDYLSEGYQLIMPKIAGSTVSNQQTQLFTSYTVPPKMNFYRLEKKFGLKSDEIIRLNPGIQERGGLKEGMVLRIPEKKVSLDTVNTDNYIFYEVKPKQNEFRLTRKFGMTWAELTSLNPELKNGLKSGMILKLPKERIGEFEVRNSLILDKVNLLDSINTAIKPKVMVLMPFLLNKLDLSDEKAVLNTMKNGKILKYSLGFYSGALIALDSMQSLGVSVQVKTFDNQWSVEQTKNILQRENLGAYSAVFGPLDRASIKEVAVQALKYEVPVVAPASSSSEISLPNVFFSYTDESVLRKHLIEWVVKNKKEENILVIADEQHEAVKDTILKYLPETKMVVVKEEEKNIGINRDDLKKLLSDEVPNWVFVESDNYKLIASVVSIVNSFHNTPIEPEVNDKKVQIRMFTTDRNSAFENDVISNTTLSSLRLTYPSVAKENSNDGFVKRYRKRFGDDPDRYAVRGFDLMYDLLLKLAYKNNLLEVSRFIGETEYSGNKFDYEKSNSSGYFNKGSYILMYDNLRIKVVE